MLTRRLHLALGLLACAGTAGLVTVACDLNPQPLPPGETSGEDAGGFGVPVNGGGADGGTNLGSTGGDGAQDAGPTSTPSIDGGAEGSDAATGSAGGDGAADSGPDASPDASGDAGSESDAVADANEDGG